MHKHRGEGKREHRFEAEHEQRGERMDGPEEKFEAMFDKKFGKHDKKGGKHRGKGKRGDFEGKNEKVRPMSLKQSHDNKHDDQDPSGCAPDDKQCQQAMMIGIICYIAFWVLISCCCCGSFWYGAYKVYTSFKAKEEEDK